MNVNSKMVGVCEGCPKTLDHTGYHMKCLVCSNYDLCGECHLNGVTTMEHQVSHAQICIRTCTSSGWNIDRHLGVYCYGCKRQDFGGHRYKCLFCDDYDLCGPCYDRGVVHDDDDHKIDHPMQCILTRAASEMSFGGEEVNHNIPQSFTCPLCGRLGFSAANLTEHVTNEHDDGFGYTGHAAIIPEENHGFVHCPICVAVSPDSFMWDDLARHLQEDDDHLPSPTVPPNSPSSSPVNTVCSSVSSAGPSNQFILRNRVTDELLAAIRALKPKVERPHSPRDGDHVYLIDELIEKAKSQESAKPRESRKADRVKFAREIFASALSSSLDEIHETIRQIELETEMDVGEKNKGIEPTAEEGAAADRHE